ncbi:MAG: pyruvate:ferredoxin (flavodoxin) oxidoreductase [Anaerolineales bacterium]|nr:pyruvate:ferredoxin (flavodoxin) oxidoreductase [Anaerolineales bacterium]
MVRQKEMIDGNTAAANVAHALSEVIAIYPITPSSPMGELADEMSAAGETNVWGTVPSVTEMQSEAGAAAAVHGALTTGALTTTFTASQGLLLMIPTMYKIAGELMPTVFHVSARAIACQALSIFGDHSDVMAVRATGFGLLASGSVQEVGDMALIATAASLASRVPFVHFFDGFRISHEIQKVELLTKDDMRALIDEEHVLANRARGMNPNQPVLRGTSQNPDVCFTARETVNRFYLATPKIVQSYMDRLAERVGRQYHLFDYVGAPDAERVVVAMGSGAEVMHETVDKLVSMGERVGLIKVRLYRPWSTEHFAQALPETVKSIAVLDRTKEPGAQGEPLYLDVCTAVDEAMADGLLRLDRRPTIVGGRYGLGSNEFNAGMCKAVLDNLKAEKPKNHFTVGITDDVTFTSLEWDADFSAEPEGTHRAMFWGLGSDGTVSANKNSIKIIGDSTDNFAQGYFYYDSKKAGSYTVSHLRFGKSPIRSSYLIDKADFVACHNFSFLQRYDMLGPLRSGGTFLLNSPYGADEIWDQLPRVVQQQIIDKKLRFYVIDGYEIARRLGLGPRINTIMQAAFFRISGILPVDEASQLMKEFAKKSYGKAGEKVVKMNYDAIDAGITGIQEVTVPAVATSSIEVPPPVPPEAPEFVQEVLGEMIAGRGTQLPVSKMPVDGTYPTGTTQYEKRNIAVEIPVWEPDVCIQCATCSLVCPHAAIRVKVYDPKVLEEAPETFKSVDARGRDFAGMKWTVQAAPEDCTGCGACVYSCPARKRDEQGNKTDIRAINMAPQIPLREAEAENFAFFLDIPETDPALFKRDTIKGSQLLRPLFEFSGACAGCGETPYIKLMTQLFGDRAIIANATGCSSIYGGNLPTTPYTKRADGCGPTWNNSLFEDSAELGLGMRLTVDKMTEYALELLEQATGCDCEHCQKNLALFDAIRNADQSTPEGIEQQRARVQALKGVLAACGGHEQLLSVADYLVKKSVWSFGGDGWAYDIGYGGLDHVLASGRNVNILVLDTEVYSNTGGQMSKATPLGAVAKFAAAGKPLGKKDLGMMMMTYGRIYVARISLGANPTQAVRAFIEAEAYDGPSIIIANAHCTMQGINMTEGLNYQKMAVESGAWILFRYDPRRKEEGRNPLILDSKEPTLPLEDYMYSENRFRMLKRANPERAAALLESAKHDVAERYRMYQQWAELD